ncbi:MULTISPECIES: alpha/beta fold hydrolase [unclassified Pseudomonas]|uniref:alpha/beta fold hydrolase n=1 Tax=unclassified Pseudomonas TaxID=196821 RepID=UPI0015A195AC|nr:MULTISPECIES: alpha/beta fold hydrolase [unclassified Pseudomonas]NWC92818.1 alpha/beta fold hydrolase [Pseudomonas sp. IPO3779]NWD17532.1 alpha/beta fold hydrolase [Pseudomonas sp. IPO3778]
MSRRLSVVLAVFLAGCGGASAAQTQVGDGGVPAFYTWADKMPASPGQMLRSEPLTAAQSLAEAGQNVRILYTSTDGLDSRKQVVVSGALFLPEGTPPPGGWPLMAWAHGTVGSADICAPSFTARSLRDTRYLNYWLEQGYAIVATDYQGLGTPGPHPYGLTSPLAYGVLDSIRAVMADEFELSKNIVVFGQSQGGRAAFATAVYAKDYAPELNIVGVVATGTPYAATHKTGDSAELEKARSSVVPTFAYNLLRLSTATLFDPSFVPADYLSERAMPAFEISQRDCLHAIEQRVVADKLTFNDSFKRSPKAALDRVYRESAYPTLKTDIPVFVGTGGQDRDVFVPGQKALVRDACKAGDRIEWHFYPELDHSATVNGSLADSTPFVRKAFAGEVITGNCGD